jgi:signal transduction histidine kinase
MVDEAEPGDTGVFTVPLEAVAPETVRGGRIAANGQLVCVAGADLGRVFRVGLQPLQIGRGSAVEINLHAIDVSRRHARIAWTEDGFTLEDQSSANGTFLNGTPVNGTVPLAIGDRVQIGASTILVFTHYDELEARMLQLQKLEAMGQLVGGIAHDFNNALMVIVSNLGYVEDQVISGDQDLRDAIEDIKQAALGASTLAKRLLSFGRREAASDDLVSMAPVAEAVAQMVQRTVGDRIKYVVAADPAADVRGSSDDLQQVLLNLCLNAHDAITGPGRVTIRARVEHLERGAALALHLPGAGDYVELTVTDTGAGMDEATLSHAFEPFFTTKPAGVGTGLGLAMVHNIVRQHGGAVQVESAIGRGTTFRILMPRAT